MMMYANKLAVAIKSNGKVLRETRGAESDKDDTVLIPFNSEYSVFVKNLNSVRALVRIQIDGTDLTPGMSLIVEPNSTGEIERFVNNGNFESGLKLKFIERTQKIEDGPRGIKVEDGLIRVEYEFEREPAKIVPQPIQPLWYSAPREVHHHHHYNDLWNRKLGSVSVGTAQDSLARGTTGSTTAMNAAMGSAKSSVFRSAAPAAEFAAPQASAASTMDSCEMDSGEMYREVKTSAGIVQPQNLNDKGITVGGSVSDQQFQRGSWFPTDGQKHVLIIKILGAVGETAVTKPVTVKTKVVCPTCGSKSKAGSRFCKECGTGLADL
jgi:hypothetical protein